MLKPRDLLRALSFKLTCWGGWSSCWCPCSWQGGWNQMIFKVPSNPNHSMILSAEMGTGGWCWSLSPAVVWRGGRGNLWLMQQSKQY